MGVQINGSEGNVIATKGTYSGNVTIGGTLTYEDVTNIDSVGLITARSGIEIGARPGVGASISVDGNAIFSGITTAATLRATTGIVTTLNVAGDVDIADKIIHTGDTDTAIRFPAADTITAETAGGERLRIDSTGSLFAGGTPLTESDLNWGHDTYQRPHIFSGNTGGTPSDGAIVAATVTENPSDSRIGAFIFGCKTSSTSGVSNSGLKAFIEGFTNTNVSDAWKTGGYMKFSTRADNGTTPAERLRINSDGNVQIGTAANAGDTLRYLDVANYNTGSNAGSILRLLTTKSDGSSAAGLDIVKYKAGGASLINYETIGSNGYISFATGQNAGSPVERLRIKSDGAFSLTSENTTGWLLKAGQDSASYSAIDGHFPTTNRTLYLNQETTHRSFVVWNKNGSDGYGFGLDNSGNFKVVSGSSERMKISSQGYLTTPSTVSFQAYGGGNWSAGNYVVLTNTNWNDGNGYNTSNGVFTAPVTGTYLFTITGLYTLNNVSAPHKIVWHVNNVNSGVLAEWQDSSIANSYNTIGNSSIIFKLSATNTVRIYVESSTAHISGGQTRYCGHLIG